MSLAATVRNFFVRGQYSGRCIVVAVSGGADSTALLLCLAELRNEELLQLHAAHVNHHLRGADSDADAAFVRDLCVRLGVPLTTLDGTLDAQRTRDQGIEASARAVRYDLLRKLRREIAADFIATAHQRDDQAETVLLRLVSGGGIAALRGIHAAREDRVIRPMLEASRADVETFLAERGVTPRFDATNDDPRYLRNRVRPLVRRLNVASPLIAIAEEARLQWELLEKAIDELEQDAVTVTPDETRFLRMPADRWLRQALLHRHIARLDRDAREVSSRDLARLAAECDTLTRVSVSRSLELVRRRDALILRRTPVPTPSFECAVAPGTPAVIEEIGAVLHVESAVDAAPRPRPQLIQLPPGAEAAFVVRNRRPGDRFQPLGTARPKKLKDFLIDRKIAVEVRDRIPLLLWNDEIVWVAGVEVSERFKVAGNEGLLYQVWLDG